MLAVSGALIAPCGQAGLADWQSNSFFAAGRVLLPSIMDTLASLCFFSSSGVIDQLLPELAGCNGRPGGAALRQIAIPDQMARPWARTYIQDPGYDTVPAHGPAPD